MLPLIGDIVRLIGKGIDKVWADKDVEIKTKADLEKFKEQLKAQLSAKVIEIALEEKRLLFQDSQSAREVYIQELKARNVPKWARAIQVLGRQFALYSTVAMYIYSKVSFQFGLPPIELNDMDYKLIGLVFVSLFGLRTLEKLRGRD